MLKTKQMIKFFSIFALVFALVSSTLPQSIAFASQPEPDTALNKDQLQKLNVTDVSTTKDGVILSLSNGYTGYIHLLTNDMIKVSVLKNGDKETDTPAIAKKDWDPLYPSPTFADSKDTYTIKTSKLTISINKQPFGIKIMDENGQTINEDAPVNGGSSGYENGKPYIFKKTSSDENFYGFGEQTGSTLNKRGKNMGNWNSDAYGYNNNTKYVYTTIPFLIGLKNGKAYGMLIDNTYRSYFNMASDSSDYYYFYANGGPLTYYFMYGPDISHVVDQYTKLTGKINLPPEWSLGLQQSAWAYTPEQLESIAQTYRDKQIPLDTMNFDIDYMNGYRVFTWNNDYKNAFNKVKSIPGMHVVTINDPGVKKDEQYSVYKDGITNDYFVKQKDGSVYIGPVWAGDSAFPNFLSSQVQNWWSSQLASALLANGVDGIWNDMNEPAVFNDDPSKNLYHTLPNDSYGIDDQGNNVTHTAFHNIYGHLEDEATYNAWAKANSNKRPFVLTRDMYAGTQRYAAIWTGDSLSDWEHLQMSLPMNMNIGLSGQAFVGNDIGGFGNEATPELFARWIELGSFLPFSRIHYDQWSDRNYHQEPWSFGSSVEKISKYYIEMRYQLLPYLYTTFHNAATTGAPVQQPLVYQYQNDPGTYNINDQFMFGDSLMLAPVVDQGKTSRSVYLPKGNKWIDYWTDTEYDGGQTITVQAPIGHLPIFVKQNAVIPMRDVQQYTDQKPLTSLILNAYADDEADATFYEDDGSTTNYQSGKYNQTAFKLVHSGNSYTFSQIKGIQGYSSQIDQYILQIHNTGTPIGVSTDSQNYQLVTTKDQLNQTKQSYYYDDQTNTTYINVPATEVNNVTLNQNPPTDKPAYTNDLDSLVLPSPPQNNTNTTDTQNQGNQQGTQTNNGGNQQGTITDQQTQPLGKVIFSAYLTKNHAVRTAPTSKASKIATLNKGTKIQVLKTGSWYTIRYKNQTAYVYGDVSKKQPVLYTAYMTNKHAVRKGAGTRYKKVAWVYTGSSVQVLSKGKYWTKIRYKNATRYVWSASVKKPVYKAKLKKTQVFRASASTHGRKLKTLRKNTTVNVLTKGTKWSKVVYGGKIGYIWNRYLKKK